MFELNVKNIMEEEKKKKEEEKEDQPQVFLLDYLISFCSDFNLIRHYGDKNNLFYIVLRYMPDITCSPHTCN